MSMILNYNVPAGQTISLWLSSGSSGATINWDGTNTTTISANVGLKQYTYNYSSAYNGSIQISGSLLQFGSGGSIGGQGIQYLTSVTSFGNLGITSLSSAFYNATGFTNSSSIPTTLPSTVTDLSKLFYYSNFNDANCKNWNVSNVTNMRQMFYGTTNFNQDISGWDVSSVTNMSSMFKISQAFNNGGVALSWGANVSNVVIMSDMFSDARVFNQDISSWDVSSVTNMSQMFYIAPAFNNGGVALNGTFASTISNVTTMNTMFGSATAFNQDISGWIFTSVTDMGGMFSDTPFNQDITGWDVSKVKIMAGMFGYTTAFNQNISGWNVSSVTDMTSMFSGSTVFNQNISGWNFSSVKNMNNMFNNSKAFNQDIRGWDVSSVTDMSGMFKDSQAFNNGGVSLSWGTNVRNVINMSGMFQNSKAFNQDISGWNVSSVTDMTGMFKNAPLFNNGGVALLWGTNFRNVRNTSDMFSQATSFNQDISSWNVSSVTNMSQMFYIAPAFNNGGVALNGTFASTTSNVRNMNTMFGSAIAFNQDISGWNVSSVTDMDTMFSGAQAFNNGGVSLSWGTNVRNVINMSGMFTNAIVFNQDISGWDVSKVTNMTTMFSGAQAFNNGGLALSWGTKVRNVISMAGMFTNAIVFNQDISGWDVSNVTNMGSMLYGTQAFNNGGVALSWGTKVGNVTDMNQIFTNATVFNQDISGWDVSKVTNMFNMFRNCLAFNKDISYWNISSVTEVRNMFYNATSFNQDISSWNVSNLTNMSEMFYNATSFNNGGVALNGTFASTIGNVTNMFGMFKFTSFNQDISSWDISKVTTMNDMFAGSSLTTYNFNNILNNWANQSVQNNVQLDGTSYSADGLYGYNRLTSSPRNWRINANYVVSINYTPSYAGSGYIFTLNYSNSSKTPIAGHNYILTNNIEPSRVLSSYTGRVSDVSYNFPNVDINLPGLNTLLITDTSASTTILRAVANLGMTVNVICFKEDSKILCFKNNQEQYIPIQELRKGDLVKTLLHNYVPINMIGKKQVYHAATSERIKDQLYKCSHSQYPEVFEDLVITGCHSILVDDFISEEEKEKAIEINSGRLCVTDDKYRLPACVDERASVYETPGIYTIYHIALENDNYYMNYGVYANGLLVETCSKRYLKELSNMELIE